MLIQKRRPITGLSALMVALMTLFSFGGIAAAQATTTTATTTTTTATSTTSFATTTYTVMIMKHLCNSNIKSVSDFQALETGKDPVAALANTVLNCPATGLTNTTAATGTIASPRTTYNFQVKNSDSSQVKNMNTDGTFKANKLCETDINKDIDGNGAIASSTCLDISDYDIPITALNMISGSSTNPTITPVATSTLFTVTETNQPSGYHFGTVRFTPTSLSANNDAQSLVSVDASSSIINLNAASDTDKTIMLHVYDFANAPIITPTTTPTTTPSTTDHDLLVSLVASIQSVQQKLDALIAQFQAFLNNNNNGNGNGNGGNGGTTFTKAAAHAASATAVIGDTDDFAGDHFQPNEQVVMTLNGQNMGTFTADKEGNWHTPSIHLPLTPGPATYMFRGVSSNAQVPVTVQVTQIP